MCLEFLCIGRHKIVVGTVHLVSLLSAANVRMDCLQNGLIIPCGVGISISLYPKTFDEHFLIEHTVLRRMHDDCELQCSGISISS